MSAINLLRSPRAVAVTEGLLFIAEDGDGGGHTSEILALRMDGVPLQAITVRGRVSGLALGGGGRWLAASDSRENAIRICHVSGSASRRAIAHARAKAREDSSAGKVDKVKTSCGVAVSSASKKSQIYAVGDDAPAGTEKVDTPSPPAASPLAPPTASAKFAALADDGDVMGTVGENGRDESCSNGPGGQVQAAGDEHAAPTEPKTHLRSAAARRWASMGAELFADSDGPLVSSSWKQTLNGISLQR